eukprot:scaffold31254_cov72-Cyclotella_meneghiniana.AAC.6
MPTSTLRSNRTIMDDNESNETSSSKKAQVLRTFWLIGLLNNAPWVLMLACAPNIASGGVALVFLSNQIPGLLVKITAPYWFHKVSCNIRMLMAAVSMCTACLLVGYGGLVDHGIVLELLGASSLALAGKFDSIIMPKLDHDNSYSELNQRRHSNEFFEDDTERKIHDADESNYRSNESKQSNQCITSFSSGTGLAGIVGYAYKSLLSEVFGLGLSAVVFSVIIFAVLYYATFFSGLHKEEQIHELSTSIQTDQEGVIIAKDTSRLVHMLDSSLITKTQHDLNNYENNAVEMVGRASLPDNDTSPLQPPQTHLTTRDRFKLVMSLWPYTIPLFTVYAAEYMLQAGVWSAIGFPVDSSTARAQFYHYSNLSYQFGVFVSRSSGYLFTASLPLLWLMPFLQVLNLLFFWMNAIHHFWYNYSILPVAFFAGILGTSIIHRFHSHHHQFTI